MTGEEAQLDPVTRAGEAAGAVAKRAARMTVRHTGRRVLIALGVKGGFWVGLIVLLLLVIAAAAGAASRSTAAAATGCGGPGGAPGCGGGGGIWDAGNIISDAVFYDSAAMTAPRIRRSWTGWAGPAVRPIACAPRPFRGPR